MITLTTSVVYKRYFRSKRSEGKKLLRRGVEFNRSKLKKLNLKRWKHAQSIERIDISALLDQKLNETLPVHEIRLPRVFCHLRNPKGTSNFLKELEDHLIKESPRRIFVNHEDVEEIGLAASWLFDELIANLRHRTHAASKKFYFQGKTSRDRNVNNFLAANGFIKKMNVATIKVQSAIDYDYWTKYQSSFKRGNKNRQELKGNASTELVEYFDKCLKNFRLKISMKGKRDLANAFSEIIGNAEEHVEAVNDWFTLGCFEKHSKYANFAIINYGPSIYETLSSAESEAQKDISQIKDAVASHRSTFEKLGSLLGLDQNWEHPIWNVMALQEGISSKRYEDQIEPSTRGQGMMDFLQFISAVSDRSEDSEIVILSGYSHIKIDFKKYKITQHVVNNESWRRICFNSEGKLDLPQDEEYIFPLKSPFQGTIITGRFKIASEHANNVRN